MPEPPRGCLLQSIATPRAQGLRHIAASLGCLGCLSSTALVRKAPERAVLGAARLSVATTRRPAVGTSELRVDLVGATQFAVSRARRGLARGGRGAPLAASIALWQSRPLAGIRRGREPALAARSGRQRAQCDGGIRRRLGQRDLGCCRIDSRLVTWRVQLDSVCVVCVYSV